MIDGVHDEELLRGGVNAVRRVGSTVVRPVGRHTPTVHRLLRHLRDRGFDHAPEALSLDMADGTETLSFLPGEVTNYPLQDSFKTDLVLVAAAEMLRDYHDATSDFAFKPDDSWFISPREPAEVVCHGDFAPYNCVIGPNGTLGVFDFDTAHPAPRLWDVGYAAYRWVPLTDTGGPADLDEQRRRLRLFCDAYGAADRLAVLAAATSRLHALVEMMHRLAAEGNEAFAGHIADGHDRLYADHIAYIDQNAATLVRP